MVVEKSTQSIAIRSSPMFQTASKNNFDLNHKPYIAEDSNAYVTFW